MDLWSHVALSTQHCAHLAGSICPGEQLRKSEVCNQKVELLIQQNVLRLEIAMGEALAVAVIQSLNQLLEVEAGHLLREAASITQKLEDFSSLGELDDGVHDL